MNKLGAITTIIVTICICIYAINIFFIDIHCKWREGITCESTSQVQANDEGEDTEIIRQDLDKVSQAIQTQSAMLQENEKQLQLNAKEIISKKATEQRELLKQIQKDGELKLQQQLEYQTQLLEKGKTIVADHESERQEKILIEK